MINRDFLENSAIGKKIFNIEYKLILFALYTGYLLFLLVTKHDWLIVLSVHAIFVFIFSVFYFGPQFLQIFGAPIMSLYIPIEEYRVKKYLKKFKKNTPEEVAIILAHSNWTKLEAWIKPNFSKKELVTLVKLLETKKQNFSFYPNASLQDVEVIMGDKKIKEVYLVGHGSSHIFQLNTDDILYYCEFNNPAYGKDFVHQIHCGTEHGKSLVDYVVPEKNRSGCFLIRKPITAVTIEKEFKRRLKNL